MLESLSNPPGDRILALMALFREDEREHKLDLGVGVYKDDNGNTPIFACVKEAEKRILETEQTKSYVGMRGDIGFNAVMTDLIFGDAASDRIQAIQSPGGCGALRLQAELIARANESATVWVSDPTWPNHIPILKSARLNTAVYPYFDAAAGSVRFDAMCEQLKQVPAGDVVLLHGCCHNPTGANLTAEQWGQVASIAEENGWLPFFDIAYQGFGDGLDEDAYSIRTFARRLPELLVVASCSKNFGLYRERVGCAMVMGKDSQAGEIAAGNIMNLARGNYSMPPNHGAAIVESIASDSSSFKAWKDELEAMRLRMLDNRQLLAQAMSERLGDNRFDYLAEHRGMFSLLGLTQEQVDELREQHAIYVVGGGGRINIAGLIAKKIPQFADALAAVI